MTEKPRKKTYRRRTKKTAEKQTLDGSAPPSKVEKNLAKVIFQFVTGKRFKPMTPATLFDRLSMPLIVKDKFDKALASLITSGVISLEKDTLFLPKMKEDTIAGILRMHPKGFGFVIPDNASDSPQDVFIPKHLTDNAVDGDHVEVVINLESHSEKGPEGKIVGVLERARKHLAGIVRQISAHGDLMVYAPILGASKPVMASNPEHLPLKIGDRVTMEVLEWGSEKEATRCKVSHCTGNIEDPSCDIKAAVEEFNIPAVFAKPVIEQAKSYSPKVPAKDLKNRVDLTDLETFTIDPDTARDFDDALSLSKDRKGNYHLAVHIADVAHYVQYGTPLDKEAVVRSNSTYFPGSCVPMLPEELSNELCSLKPDVIRLTVSVLMDFDKEGTLIKHEIVRSYIKSIRRFTYFEAKDVLDGKLKSPHEKTLKLMVSLCELLKKKRYERGSIDFSLPETVILIDDKGMPTGMKRIEYDITHQLVEEFMLKANEMVARELSSRKKSLIFRVHEVPSPENFEDFLSLARSLGFKVPAEPTHKDLQALFNEAKPSPFYQQLSVAFIRSMKLAQYSPDNIGHFGLALEYYCHFTSPIRRYSDLVIQRLLFNEEPEDLDLEKIAQHCSDQERVSFRAETSVKTLKKLRLLRSYFQENLSREYPAVITKIKPFGLFFELKELMMEGFLHISELEDDYFVYNQERNILVGRSSGKTHRLGTEIQVSLVEIDLIVLESRWELASPNKRKKEHSSHRERRRRH